MGQTPEGAKKAAKTAKRLYGKDHHSKIGAVGGKNRKNPNGFDKDSELAREAGRKGGKAKKGWRKSV